MNLNDALNEKTIPVVSEKPLARKLRMYRGINFIILGEEEPPDVHGIPKSLEAYGRGWVEKKDNEIIIDGGPMGSSQGHPPTALQGFYWGADYDKIWEYEGKRQRGVIYIRGRVGTDPKWFERNVETILELIFKRLPKN